MVPSGAVKVDGWPVAPNTAVAFNTRLKPAFEKAFPGITLHVYSGYRSYADQVKIFTDRYRRGAYSPFGDYRTWDGSRWGRVSGEGTVAAPGMSNHQSGHALDIRDSGSSVGVTTANNARSNWIRANASKYGFSPIGYTFGEPWHIEFIGDPWQAGSGSGGSSTGAGGIDSTEEEMDMGAGADAALWLKDRVGGTLKQGENITDMLRTINENQTKILKQVKQNQDDIEWLKSEVGGTYKDSDNVQSLLREVLSKLK